MQSLEGAEKPLDRMDRLSDLTCFPAMVNAGATANILITLAITWWLAPQYPQVYAPVAWTFLVLSINLLPVVVLRAISFNASPIPSLRAMNFFRDQHRFADWVYLAASANMAFWLLVAWPLFTLHHTLPALAAVLAVAFLVTFSPVLLRSLRR